MSKVLAELKEKAAQLPEPERAELALSLIESLDGPADEGVEEAWDREISRRMAEIERGEAKLVPADEVFTRLRRRLG
jgi:putative addiction module component (TIGR02574 family)